MVSWKHWPFFTSFLMSQISEVCDFQLMLQSLIWMRHRVFTCTMNNSVLYLQQLPSTISAVCSAYLWFFSSLWICLKILILTRCGFGGLFRKCICLLMPISIVKSLVTEPKGLLCLTGVSQRAYMIPPTASVCFSPLPVQ